jgi:hypothetical protein
MEWTATADVMPSLHNMEGEQNHDHGSDFWELELSGLQAIRPRSGGQGQPRIGFVHAFILCRDGDGKGW